MKDLRLDPITKDLDVTGNALHFAQGAEATAQHLGGRLSLNLGEWFLNERIGVPYQRDVFRRHTARSLATLEAMYRRCIETSPGVKSLLSFSMKLDKDRVLRLSFVALNDQNERVEVKDFEPDAP